MKFFKRNLERVQAGGINCWYRTHSKNHDARHTQGTRQGGLELLRHAEEERAFNSKYQHAFRHIFFTNGIAPTLQLAFTRHQYNLPSLFCSLNVTLASRS